MTPTVDIPAGHGGGGGGREMAGEEKWRYLYRGEGRWVGDEIVVLSVVALWVFCLVYVINSHLLL